MPRIGFGNDLHRLETGRKLIIGGIEIPSEKGAIGHSDADVLLHAITDALLGSLALGDIGSHFPNTDLRWKDENSSVFLREAVKQMKERGFQISNVDSTISLEKPKLRSYINEIRLNIAELLEIDFDRVSIKAKTGEGLEAIGNSKAIKAEACILIQEIPKSSTIKG